jgi:hypothetical protein
MCCVGMFLTLAISGISQLPPPFFNHHHLSLSTCSFVVGSNPCDSHANLCEGSYWQDSLSMTPTVTPARRAEQLRLFCLGLRRRTGGPWEGPYGSWPGKARVRRQNRTSPGWAESSGRVTGSCALPGKRVGWAGPGVKPDRGPGAYDVTRGQVEGPDANDVMGMS